MWIAERKKGVDHWVILFLRVINKALHESVGI